MQNQGVFYEYCKQENLNVLTNVQCTEADALSERCEQGWLVGWLGTAPDCLQSDYCKFFYHTDNAFGADTFSDEVAPSFSMN